MNVSSMLKSTNGILANDPVATGAVLRKKYNRRKAVYFGCCPARILLAVIILSHTFLLAIWIIKEYYLFDFKCASFEKKLMESSYISTNLNFPISPKLASSINLNRDTRKTKIKSEISKDNEVSNLEEAVKNNFATEALQNRSNIIDKTTVQRIKYRSCNNQSIQLYGKFVCRCLKKVRSHKIITSIRISKTNIHQCSNPKYLKNLREKLNCICSLFELKKNISADFYRTINLSKICQRRILRECKEKKVFIYDQIRDSKNLNNSRNGRFRKKGRKHKVAKNNDHSSHLEFAKSTNSFIGNIKLYGNDENANLQNTEILDEKIEKQMKGEQFIDRNSNTVPESMVEEKIDLKDGRQKKTSKGKGNKSRRKKKRKKASRNKENNTGNKGHSPKSDESLANDDEHKRTKKRFHLLGGSDTSMKVGNQKSSWFHGVVNPDDENFNNKGEIRFYSGKIASVKPTKGKKQKPTRSPPVETDSNRKKVEYLDKNSDNANFSNQSLENIAYYDKKYTRKWKTAEDAHRRPAARMMSRESAEWQKNEDEMDSSEGSGEITLSTIQLPVPYVSSLRTRGNNDKNNFVQTTQPSISGFQYKAKTDYINNEHFSKLSTVNYLSPVVLSTHLLPKKLETIDIVRNIGYQSVNSTSNDKVKASMNDRKFIKRKRENFLSELNAFSSMALCITRIFLDLWCLAECIAAIPFFIGVWYPFKCLFALHIILATLFIVITFIYSITIAVYSLILYSLVPEMHTWVLLEWLSFAAITDIILIIYFIFFMVLLKCCDLIIENGLGFNPKLQFKRNYQST